MFEVIVDSKRSWCETYCFAIAEFGSTMQVSRNKLCAFFASDLYKLYKLFTTYFVKLSINLDGSDTLKEEKALSDVGAILGWVFIIYILIVI